MNKIAVFIFFSLLLCVSCKTTQPIANKAEQPQWVSSRPQNSGYYIGISSASKKGITPASYRASAKQNALSDLSSEISIHIESSSMLNSMQMNQNFSQQFVNDIKTNNTLQLEGYELVDTYEDDDLYWVYYRLSKSDYEAWKAQRKQQAVDAAKNKYLQANSLLQNKLHFNAFQLYAEALSAISAYLNESNICLLDQQEEDLGNAIYNALVHLLNEAQFSAKTNDIEVKKGVEISDDAFCFILQDASQNAMANMPIKVNFSGSGLMKNTETTNNEGKICCSLPKIKSDHSQETLSLSVDVVSLSRVVTDHLVRSIIKNIPVVERQIRVVLQKPSLQITSDEQMMNVRSSDNLLKEFLTDHLYTAFDLSDAATTDFTLNVQCNTHSKDYYNQLYYVELECVITLNNAKGQTVYRKRIKDDFSGKNNQEASEKGFQEVLKIFDRSVLSEIKNTVY